MDARGLAVVCVLGGWTVARADAPPPPPVPSVPASDGYVPSMETTQWLMNRLWPELPEGHLLSLEDTITGHLTDYGNEFGKHLDLLSHDMLMLSVDGKHNSARLRLGGGNVHYLTFVIDGDVHFHDGMASVKARLDLGLAGHMLHVDLPDFDMSQNDYHGERYVEISVPLFERKF